MSESTSKSETATKPATSMALKVCAWVWCVGMALMVIALAAAGNIMAALAFGISAFLAVAPSSWHLFAQSGEQSGRGIKIAIVLGAFVVGAFYAAFNPDAHRKRAVEQVAETKSAAMPSMEAPSTCEGSKAAPKDFAILEGAPLHERADARSGKVSIPFGVNRDMKPVSVDTTMPVRELCRSGAWSFISILQLPSDIGNAKGWVPTAILRPVKTDRNGRRIYEPADFDWSGGSLRYQKAILTVVNRVMAQNSKCDAFNSQSILLDKDRTGPLIKVACFGSEEQIVDFRPEDATNGRSFAPIAPVLPTDERTALAYCETALTERAAHPSTVEIGSGTFKPYGDGSSTYETTFTAKNSFNLTLKYEARCSFLGSKLTNIEINETAE